MFDFSARIKRACAAMAARLSAFGMGAVAQLCVGFVVALIAVPLIAASHSWVALPVLLTGLTLLAIGQANARARISALSSALCLIVLASVPFAFALGDPARALAVAFLLFGLIAAGAASLFADKDRALPMMDVVVSVFAFSLACLVPQWFSLIAYVLGVSCFVAAGTRFALALARGGA